MSGGVSYKVEKEVATKDLGRDPTAPHRHLNRPVGRLGMVEFPERKNGNSGGMYRGGEQGVDSTGEAPNRDSKGRE